MFDFLKNYTEKLRQKRVTRERRDELEAQIIHELISLAIATRAKVEAEKCGQYTIANVWRKTEELIDKKIIELAKERDAL